MGQKYKEIKEQEDEEYERERQRERQREQEIKQQVNVDQRQRQKPTGARKFAGKKTWLIKAKIINHATANVL